MNGASPIAAADTRIRQLELGPHASLQFLARSPLDGRRLRAELRIRAPDNHAGHHWQPHFAGIEFRLYAEIEGLGRATALVDGMAAASDPDAIVHQLVFELSAEQVDAVRLGADLGFGVDDDRMRVGARVKGQLLATLLSELR